MSIIIRLCFILVLYTVCIIVARKRKGVRSKYFLTIAMIGMIILFIFSGIFPFENIFISFDTPENALDYWTTHGKIIHIIDGEDSCLVVYYAKDSESKIGLEYFPKDDSGYKLPTVLTKKIIICKFTNNGLIELDYIRGTNDYYIYGDYHANDDCPAIADEIGTKFINQKDTSIENLHSFYGYINGKLPKPYKINIDGETVFIEID